MPAPTRRAARAPLRPLRLVVDGVATYARVARVARRAAAGQVGATRTPTPVVCVHGFGVSGRYFVPLARRLGARGPVYVPDLPGHGRSGNPAAPLDVPGLAHALLRWMDATGLRRVALVANSMGAQVAVALAVQHPARVERLVLVGPTAEPVHRHVPGYLLRLIACVPFERPTLWAIIAADYLRMHWRLVPELRALLGDRIEDRLARVRCPVLLVRGAHDAVAPRRWLDTMAAALPDAQVVEMARGGHAVHHSRAGDCVAVMTPFLDAPPHATSHAVPAAMPHASPRAAPARAVAAPTPSPRPDGRPSR